MLLDKNNTLVGQLSLGVDSLGLLDEDTLSGGGLKVLGEDSSALSDHGGGFVVLKNFLFELLILFGSLIVELNDVSLISSDFSLFLLLDSGKDLSSWVKVTFEFSLELNSLSVAFSQVLIVASDISIAALLEIIVVCIILLLFTVVSVLQVVEGGNESVQRIS